MRCGALLALGLLLAQAVGCLGGNALQNSASGGGSTVPGINEGGGETPTPVSSFVALPRTAQLRKVKFLLTGEAPDQTEQDAYARDDTVLRRLIADWLQGPASRAILQDFFTMQFQQGQMRAIDFPLNMYDTEFVFLNDGLAAALRNSFGRTVMRLVDENAPFTQTMTTRRFMMTTEMMAYYAYTDTSRATDTFGRTNTWQTNNAAFGPKFRRAAGPVASTDAANPNGPLWLTFYLPRLGEAVVDGASPNRPSNGAQLCRSLDPLTLTAARNFGGSMEWGANLWRLVNGGGLAYTLPQMNDPAAVSCQVPGDGAGYFTAKDANDWRMVDIRVTPPGQNHSEFFDLDTLRNGNTLSMQGERVGFFTTPAFLSQWGTNASNNSRAAVNQTLIVALGGQVDGTDALPLTTPSAVDPKHAADAACFSCHQTLDPLRQYLRQSFTLSYSPQTDPAQANLPAQFVFRGHAAGGRGVGALGEALASHPNFALAWTQKLCSWANSGPCLADDPELRRVSQVFVASNYNFRALLIELFSSPLVTSAASTATAERFGPVASIARRSQLCHGLEQRLGIVDLCHLEDALADGQDTVASRAAALPRDGYSRGVDGAQFVTTPDPFYLSNLENICALSAVQAVDGPAAWASSNDTNAAIAKMVATLFGATRAEAAEPETALRAHYDAAVAAQLSATDALRSVFVAACSSAAAASIGQ